MMKRYFKWCIEILQKIDHKPIGKMIDKLDEVRKRNGRLFILGVGGSAANASHAACDFRKLCDIEAYAFDNIAELTARTNDDGWDSVFREWLRGNKLNKKDAVMIFSVGGGNEKVSVNLIQAIDFAKGKCEILGIVGRDGGYTKKNADICLVIPTVSEYLVTPFVESFQ